MKTLKEQKEAIWIKIQEINSMNISDIEVFNEDGTCNCEKLNEYIQASKKKNYAQAACMRMIKRLLKNLYGEGWPLRGTYIDYVHDFKQFA